MADKTPIGSDAISAAAGKLKKTETQEKNSLPTKE